MQSRFSSSNDPDPFIILPVTMRHNQQFQPDAIPKENKALFIFRVFRVWNNPSLLIIESGPGFLKRYSMFFNIRRRFSCVPSKFHFSLHLLL